MPGNGRRDLIRRLKVNKSRIDVTVRGVDYEGKFSHFPGEFYMLYVLVNGNVSLSKGFARCVMGFSPFLSPKFSWFQCTFS